MGRSKFSHYDSNYSYCGWCKIIQIMAVNLVVLPDIKYLYNCSNENLFIVAKMKNFVQWL